MVVTLLNLVAKIKDVAVGSLADELGLEPNDELVAINGHRLRDIVDYYYYSDVSSLALTVGKPDGEVWIIETEKEPDEPLGITFFQVLFNRVKSCANQCMFCFEDQMPKGMRPSLKEKDDDYRLSFLYGNFITLTNLSKSDWQRISEQRLTPLYLSVHATDPKVRARLLGNPKGAQIREQLDWLREHQIQVHCQVVLCPEENDGQVLISTLEDLKGYWPNVLSVAVVPVGLTKHRAALPSLRSVTHDEAKRLIAWFAEFQTACLGEFGTRFAWLSDEFYYLARQEVPSSEEYEDYPQLENGVGMVASFLEELAQCSWPGGLRSPRHVTAATASMGAYFLRSMFDDLSRVENLQFCVEVIKSNFFGPLVTATGLITGADLIASLKGKELGDYLVLPAVTVNQDLVFLDDVHLEDVARELNVKIRLINGAPAMAKFITELAEG